MDAHRPVASVRTQGACGGSYLELLELFYSVECFLLQNLVASDVTRGYKRNMQTSTYYIEHTKEGSTSLGRRTKHIVTGTYQDAVNAAHAIWQKLAKKTLVCVYTKDVCLDWYHWISADGTVKDRNTNSGVKW